MKRIYTLCVFVAEDGDEGIAAFYDPRTQTHIPMVAADEARVDSLRPIAQQIASASGCTIRLFRFQVREMLEEITP